LWRPVFHLPESGLAWSVWQPPSGVARPFSCYLVRTMDSDGAIPLLDRLWECLRAAVFSDVVMSSHECVLAGRLCGRLHFESSVFCLNMKG
jgi:hypothetical protein